MRTPSTSPYTIPYTLPADSPPIHILTLSRTRVAPPQPRNALIPTMLMANIVFWMLLLGGSYLGLSMLGYL